jgi:hypothetical protein
LASSLDSDTGSLVVMVLVNVRQISIGTTVKNLPMNGRDTSQHGRVKYRHILVGMALLFGLGFSFRGYGASCYPPSTELLAWWPGDGNASDIAGTNSGTLQSGATANAAGVSGSAFSFDGTNGYVQIADSPVLRPTNLTIECWVLFTGLDSLGLGSSPAGDQYLVFRQNSRSGGFEGFALTKTRVGGSDVFNFTVASAAGQPVVVNSTTAISSGIWHHVAATRGSNFIQLYVNGALEDQASVSFPQDYGNFPLYFATSGQSYWDHKLKGSLDEVSIYNRALTAAEIAGIAAAGASGKCQLPYVTSVPAGQEVLPGATLTLSISAIGLGPLSYQWYHEGTNLVNGSRVYGATSSLLTLSNVVVSDAGNYSAVVSNSRGSTPPYYAYLQVGVPAGITAQPTNLTVVAESSAQFQSGASGMPAPGYQWFFNGAVLTDGAHITGSKSAALTVAAAQTNDAGNYWLVASNSSGSATSTVATLTVLVPSYISAQPTNQTVPLGTNAFFQSGGFGIPAPNFQWLFNGAVLADGAHITGSKSAALTIAAAQTNDAGNYWLVASNSSGSATSTVATLTVLVPSYLTAQPTNLTVPRGTNALFQSGASGIPAPSYQWLFNGTVLADGGRITGSKSAALTIAAAQTNDAGGYWLVASNSLGSATSTVATLTVLVPSYITAQPTNQTVPLGTNAFFQSGASGIPTPNYQWFFSGTVLADGGRITGSKSASLNIAAAQTNDAGSYWSVASNSVGSATSTVATLTVLVLVPPAITTQPTNQIVQLGIGNTNVAFSVTASGTAPLAYSWRKGSVNLSNSGRVSGVSNSTLAISGVLASDAGDYTVVLTNLAGATTSTVATLTVVVVPPTITGQPVNQTNSAGTSATFSATAAGSPPLFYQWTFNSATLAGATNTSLVLGSVQLSNAGNYTLVVTNAGGAITSAPAALTVVLPPCVPAPQNLVSWWPGENSSVDATGQNNGTNAGTGSFGYGPGVVGQAFVFDGVHRDRVDLGNPASLRLQDFTIDAWIKRSSPIDISHDDNNADGSTTGEGGTFFGYGRVGYGFGMLNNGQLFLSRVDIDGILSTNVAADTNWHHVAVTKAGFSVRFYIDGAPASPQMGYSNTFSFDTSAAIGSRGDARGGTFFGMMDEPSVFSRGLSAAEVQAIYQAGMSGKCPLPPAIVAQPSGQTTNAGANVQFRVTAGGLGPFAYQWRRNQSNNVGVNSSALNLTNVTRSNNAVFSVLVSNIGGVAVSSNAVLRVLVPQKFAAPVVLTNKSVVFISHDADGGLLSPADLPAFTALASTNLVNWATLPGALSVTNGQLLLRDVNQSNYPARFYRILEQ